MSTLVTINIVLLYKTRPYGTQHTCTLQCVIR